MGSQQTYHEEHAAPAAIVVYAAGFWFIAVREGAWQPNRDHGGMGPVVVRYRQRGRSYASQEAATTDAALIIARESD